MKYLILFSILIGFYACTNEKKPEKVADLQLFSENLETLKGYFSIPGMAAIVKKGDQILFEEYFGEKDVAGKKVVDSNTIFPIASITKVFSAALLFQLEEEGQLQLTDPINQYLPELEIPDSIQIQHVLSHTSQGEPGKQFYYSFRFGWLTMVIERASGRSFKALMREKIFDEIGLEDTYFISDTSSIKSFEKDLAQPYLFDQEIQSGQIEYGASASAGIASTAKDLLKFDEALRSGKLISNASLEKMTTPFTKGSPYGLGIFSQMIADKKILWSYGQYDCYSSLYISVPEDDLTLVLLANNNLMSDPARLIYGDINYSLFAWNFLNQFVLNTPREIWRQPEHIDQDLLATSSNYRDQLLAQSLAASFMSRFNTNQMKVSTAILEQVFEAYPDLESYAHLSLMHNLTFLKDVAFYMDLEENTQFDEQIVELGKYLLSMDADNPYANIYLATFYDRKGKVEAARSHFERIVNAPNFSSFWYTKEAQAWLTQHPE
jgi:CubicO group peptidase (beta-lactamase class C family)